MEGTVSDTLLSGPVNFYEGDDGTPVGHLVIVKTPSPTERSPAAAGPEPNRSSGVRGLDCGQRVWRLAGPQVPAGISVPSSRRLTPLSLPCRPPATSGGKHTCDGDQLLRLQQFIDNGLAASIRGDDSVYGRISA